MTKRQLKNTIIASYSSAADAELAAIKLSCEGVVQETEMPQFLLPRKTGDYRARQWMIILASLVLVILCGHLAVMTISNTKPAVSTNAVTSAGVVTDLFIDVNPSIEMTLDRENRVVSCKAVNSDAYKILQGLDLKGTKFSVAFSAIVGTLYMNGYLQGETDAMLVSIDTSLPDVIDSINSELKTIFENNGLTCAVLVQELSKDKVLEQAESNGISSGKMELIDRIIEKSEKLSEANIKELAEHNILYLTKLLNELLEPDKNHNIIDDILDGTGEVVDDTLEGVDKVVDETLEGVDKVVDETLEGVDKVVDETLEGVDKVVDETLEGVDKVVDETLEGVDKVVDEILEGVDKVVDDIHEGIDKIIDDIFNQVLQ